MTSPPCHQASNQAPPSPPLATKASHHLLLYWENTSSESSNNSSGLVPIASLTLHFIHNRPYTEVLSLPPMFDSRDFFPPEEIPPPKDTETPIESPISKYSASTEERERVSRRSSMPPKRTSTSAAPAMTQAAIKKLVADSVSAALGAQAATLANTNNTNRNTGEREAPVARKCSYNSSNDTTWPLDYDSPNSDAIFP
ncbi:hypothetical protein Tco_0603018 [Tanacetum coccineum]